MGEGAFLLLIAAIIVVSVVAQLLRNDKRATAGDGDAEKLQRHIDAINGALQAFDGTSDLDAKQAWLPTIEGELAAILALAPEHETAKLLARKMPAMKEALASAAPETAPAVAAEIPGNQVFPHLGLSSGQDDQGDMSIDEMRSGMQKMAYEVSRKWVPQEEKDRFKRDMTEFASLDPLVREIVERANDIIQQNPGMLQSKIYVHFPGYDMEKVRYALYFAHELGWIYRKKKGSSYQLFPAGVTIDA